MGVLVSNKTEDNISIYAARLLASKYFLMSVPFYAKAYIKIRLLLAWISRTVFIFLVSHLVRYMTKITLKCVIIAKTLIIMRKNVQLQMYTTVSCVVKVTLLKIVSSFIHKCINCVRNDVTEVDHPANSFKCQLLC